MLHGTDNNASERPKWLYFMFTLSNWLCTIADSGILQDLAGVMIRDCRYDVSNRQCFGVNESHWSQLSR